MKKLLIHGKDDESVPFKQSKIMCKNLKRAVKRGPLSGPGTQ